MIRPRLSVRAAALVEGSLCSACTHAAAQTGAVTLIQRFGSALNLNIHFHILCLDGAYALEQGRPRFRRVPPPTPAELDALLQQITARIARHLERRGLLVRDLELSHLDRAPGVDAALEYLQGHSITYRIALGSQEDRKAFTLQTVPAREPLRKPLLASHAGFSRHAGVAVRGDHRKTLERLCRYIICPTLTEGRLSVTPQGWVRYTLKTPYRDDTTHVVFEPVDFMARLAALFRDQGFPGSGPARRGRGVPNIFPGNAENWAKLRETGEKY